MSQASQQEQWCKWVRAKQQHVAQVASLWACARAGEQLLVQLVGAYSGLRSVDTVISALSACIDSSWSPALARLLGSGAVRDALTRSVCQAPAGQAAPLTQLAAKLLAGAILPPQSDMDGSQPHAHAGASAASSPRVVTVCRLVACILAAVRADNAQAPAVASKLRELATTLAAALSAPAASSDKAGAMSDGDRRIETDWVCLLEVYTSVAGLWASCSASHPSLELPFGSLLGALVLPDARHGEVPSLDQLEHLLLGSPHSSRAHQRGDSAALRLHCAGQQGADALDCAALAVGYAILQQNDSKKPVQLCAVMLYALQRLVQLHDECLKSAFSCRLVTCATATAATDVPPELPVAGGERDCNARLRSLSTLVAAAVVRRLPELMMSAADGGCALAAAVQQMPVWAQHASVPTLEHVLVAAVQAAVCADSGSEHQRTSTAACRQLLAGPTLWRAVPDACAAWTLAMASQLSVGVACLKQAVHLACGSRAGADAASLALHDALQTRQPALTPELMASIHANLCATFDGVADAACYEHAVAASSPLNAAVAQALQQLQQCIGMAASSGPAVAASALAGACDRRSLAAPLVLTAAAVADLMPMVMARLCPAASQHSLQILRSCLMVLAKSSEGAAACARCAGAVQVLCNIHKIATACGACLAETAMDDLRALDVALFTLVKVAASQAGRDGGKLLASSLASALAGLPHVCSAAELLQGRAPSRGVSLQRSRSAQAQASSARNGRDPANSTQPEMGMHQSTIVLHATCVGALELWRKRMPTNAAQGLLQPVLWQADAIAHAKGLLLVVLENARACEPCALPRAGSAASSILESCAAALGHLVAVEACCAAWSACCAAPAGVGIVGEETEARSRVDISVALEVCAHRFAIVRCLNTALLARAAVVFLLALQRLAAHLIEK
jgi:hypothetical protein